MIATSARTHIVPVLAAALTLFLPSRSQAVCLGDCNADNRVAVSELVTLVNINLESAAMSLCPVGDTDHDDKVSVNELVGAVNSALKGCGTSPTPTATPVGNCLAGATTFNSTFEAIQKVIFEKHSCNTAVCHGSVGKQGGLDLSPDVAYDNIVGKRATSSDLNLIQLGDKDRSYLWLKLAAATDPSMLPPGFQIAGAAMPNGLPPISAGELEALRRWIYGGAPETGTVDGTQELLDACLPPPEPIIIAPLEAPAAGTGIQLTMPEWDLEAHSEHEICFATYYDISDQVPAEYQDPTGTMFRFSANELRQDPSSHHLILNRFFGPEVNLHDAAFGAWTCAGGDHEGQTCEPTDKTSCGTGLCRSEIKQSFACVGFGPRGTSGICSSTTTTTCQRDGQCPSGETCIPPGPRSIGGAQAAQSFNDYIDGVFAQIPTKGVLYWNSHAFNLTNGDTTMHAWLNYYFSNDQRYPVHGIFNTTKIFAANAAPYTTQTICNDSILPKGARLFNLSSHTHKHGKHFTVTVPDGSTIYENFVYNDPADITYDPPIPFDSDKDSERTLHFCSLYNNGMKADGSPDVTLVTRASLVPSSAQLLGNCSPIACVAGKVGAACNGKNDDRTCDSSPGANDGDCDACRITGGESTQNEMFILIGAYYIAAPEGSGGAAGAELFDASGRSTSSEISLPHVKSCSSSGGHMGHGMDSMEGMDH